jgi:hypothetical protein
VERGIEGRSESLGAHRHVRCVLFPHEASPISIQINRNTGVWFSKRTERNIITSPAYIISASETECCGRPRWDSKS